MIKPRNPVARFARQRAAVFRDRRKASKQVRGNKHKKSLPFF